MNKYYYEVRVGKKTSYGFIYEVDDASALQRFAKDHLIFLEKVGDKPVVIKNNWEQSSILKRI